jgi:cytochrome c oxidase subunit 4/cytochrome o ubiquinol oxidase operon protein cyoD
VEEHATHDQHAEAHESHGTGFYWMVGAILAVVTAIEVAIFLVKDTIGHELFLAILFILSIAKAAGVVMFFMHLRGDAKIFQFVFIVPLIFAVTMCLGFLTLFENYGGIAG